MAMIDEKRANELRELLRTGEIAMRFPRVEDAADLLAILDALPALKAEVERWKDEWHGMRDAGLAYMGQAETAEAELAEARPLIEDAVDYVREHLADHLAALGETTAKNKGWADDMRRIIHAADAFREKA